MSFLKSLAQTVVLGFAGAAAYTLGTCVTQDKIKEMKEKKRKQQAEDAKKEKEQESIEEDGGEAKVV